MLASAISSSCGESGLTGSESTKRSSGRARSRSGRNKRASPSMSQGSPVAIGGTKLKAGERLSTLYRWVVPLRQWPTMKRGGGVGVERRRSTAVTAPSTVENGQRMIATVSAIPARSRCCGAIPPLPTSTPSSVVRSAPQSGCSSRWK